MNKKYLALQKFRFTSLSYNEEGKKAFHSAAKSFLKQLAKDLNISDYDLRSNMGGIAVSGEITLHTPDLYVQISDGPFNGDIQALVRTCKGKKDYTGGNNHFFFFNKGEYAEMVELCGRLLNKEK